MWRRRSLDEEGREKETCSTVFPTLKFYPAREKSPIWERGAVRTGLRSDRMGMRGRGIVHRWADACRSAPAEKTGTGLASRTSAPGPGSPLAYLHRDWAHRCHICTGAGLTAATSAPGLDIARQFSMGTDVLEMSLERERF